MLNSIFFFPKRGAKNSQFAADCQSESFKYKPWVCNAQIPKDKIRVVLNLGSKKGTHFWGQKGHFLSRNLKGT